MVTNIADEVLVGKFDGIEMDLAEIFQTKSIRFAFLSQIGNNEFQPFHPPVKCRDFLSDILQNACTKEEVDFYGFNFSFEDNGLDLNTFRLLLDFPSIEMAKKLNKNFEFLLEKEKTFFDVFPSKLFAVKGTEKKLVIEGDKYWQSATQLTSLYTYICRALLYLKGPEGDWTLELPLDSVDGNYMKRMREAGFDKKFPLLRHLPIKESPTPSGFAKSRPIYESHEYGGILNFMLRYSHDKTRPNFLHLEMEKLCAAA